MDTHVYKKVGQLELQADVYRPAEGKAPHPVVIFFHGGSLINGGRQSLWRPLQILEDLLAAGIVVVSVDYRLAPETKLPEIARDVEDAFAWVRRDGPKLFDADPARVAVAGGSAGGYLALLAGARVEPRPKAVLSEMGYGDPIGAWQMRPSIHPPHYGDSNLDETEAWKQVSGPPISNVRDRRGNGGAFNDFIRRTAAWPKAISGWDPKTEPEKFEPYRPVRRVAPDYPPTLLIHGERDTDVPLSQAEEFAAELKRHGVTHELIVIKNAEHGNRGAEMNDVLAAHRRAVEFLRRHLGT